MLTLSVIGISVIIAYRCNSTNLQTLLSGITEFWKTLTPEICTKYISHIQKKVIPKVIEVNGEASGYWQKYMYM